MTDGFVGADLTAFMESIYQEPSRPFALATFSRRQACFADRAFLPAA
jgi:hypothetical protein